MKIKLVDEEETNGLGLILNDILSRTLVNPPSSIRKWRGKITIYLRDADVASTIIFNGNAVLIKNGKVDGANLYIESDYMSLADVSTRRVSALMSIMRGRLKVKGNLFTLLKLQSILLLPKEG